MEEEILTVLMSVWCNGVFNIVMLMTQKLLYNSRETAWWAGHMIPASQDFDLWHCTDVRPWRPIDIRLHTDFVELRNACPNLFVQKPCILPKPADIALNRLGALGYCECLRVLNVAPYLCIIHWPADGVYLVCVFVLAGAVRQAVAQSHQTLSETLIDGVTPSGWRCGNRARAQH